MRSFSTSLCGALALLTTVGCSEDAIVGTPGPGSGGGSATSSASSGASGGGGGAGGSVGLAHRVRISEVAVSPGTAEFIELWNPTGATVDLDDYYLSDDSSYYRIAYGSPWNPGNPDSDFLVRFPPGTKLGPGEVIVLQAGVDLEQSFGACPDFMLGPSRLCETVSIPPMDVPTGGGLPSSLGGMLQGAEMLALFRFVPETGVVVDVDYLTWGDSFDASSRADKTGEPGYAPDTPRDMQRPAPRPDDLLSIARCAAGEVGETLSGGNGLDGHDETSENFAAAFEILLEPTPGEPGGCP